MSSNNQKSDFPDELDLFPTSDPFLAGLGTTGPELDFEFDLGPTKNPFELFTTNGILPGES